MPWDYKDCNVRSRGRFGPLTVLSVPMRLIMGLDARRNRAAAEHTFDELFEEAFRRRALPLKTSNGSIPVPEGENLLTEMEIELPQDVDDGVNRVRKFVDSLYENQAKKTQ